MAERRRLGRTAARHPATIIFGQPATMHACHVEDLTSRGACLVVTLELVLSLPNTFDLTFDDGRTLRPCSAVWRKWNRIGIEW